MFLQNMLHLNHKRNYKKFRDESYRHIRNANLQLLQIARNMNKSQITSEQHQAHLLLPQRRK